MGYGFINFVNTEILLEFYKKFHNKKWIKFRSDKVQLFNYTDLHTHLRQTSRSLKLDLTFPKLKSSQSQRQEVPANYQGYSRVQKDRNANKTAKK